MIVLCKCLLQSLWVNFKIIYIVMHPSTGCRGKCIMFTLGGASQKILNSSLAIGQAAVTVCREGPLLAWTDPLSIGQVSFERDLLGKEINLFCSQLVFFFFLTLFEVHCDLL